MNDKTEARTIEDTLNAEDWLFNKLLTVTEFEVTTQKCEELVDEWVKEIAARLRSTNTEGGDHHERLVRHDVVDVGESVEGENHVGNVNEHSTGGEPASESRAADSTSGVGDDPRSLAGSPTTEQREQLIREFEDAVIEIARDPRSKPTLRYGQALKALRALPEGPTSDYGWHYCPNGNTWKSYLSALCSGCNTCDVNVIAEEMPTWTPALPEGEQYNKQAKNIPETIPEQREPDGYIGQRELSDLRNDLVASAVITVDPAEDGGDAPIFVGTPPAPMTVIVGVNANRRAYFTIGAQSFDVHSEPTDEHPGRPEWYARQLRHAFDGLGTPPVLAEPSERLKAALNVFRPGIITTCDVGMCQECGGHTPSGMNRYCSGCAFEIIEAAALASPPAEPSHYIARLSHGEGIQPTWSRVFDAGEDWGPRVEAMRTTGVGVEVFSVSPPPSEPPEESEDDFMDAPSKMEAVGTIEMGAQQREEPDVPFGESPEEPNDG